ncbi:MAG: methyltransferase domain-containing protein [Cellvibrionaceae bacterium]
MPSTELPSNQSSESILMCPVCHSLLVKSERTFHCENRHSFDQAKEGYINLLLVNQKSSKNPGDSTEMLLARREFLDAEYYQPIAKGIAECIEEVELGANKSHALLDCGCGEGYYLNQLRKNLKDQWQTYGLDISKDGVRLAAKRYKESGWICASGEHLPIMDNSLDVLLRVFAPGNNSEVYRVLNEKGILINVSPGENHLIEIKSALYDEIKPYAIPNTPEGFFSDNIKKIKYNIALNDNKSVKQLLSMTPFMWKGKREARDALKEKDSLSVTVDMDIHCYKKQ